VSTAARHCYIILICHYYIIYILRPQAAIERQPGNESCLSQPTPTSSSRLRPRPFPLGSRLDRISCPSRVCTVALPNPAGVSRLSQPASQRSAAQHTNRRCCTEPRLDTSREKKKRAPTYYTPTGGTSPTATTHPSNSRHPSHLHASRKESPLPSSHPRVVGLLVRPSAPERQQDRVTFGERTEGRAPSLSLGQHPPLTLRHPIPSRAASPRLVSLPVPRCLVRRFEFGHCIEGRTAKRNDAAPRRRLPDTWHTVSRPPELLVFPLPGEQAPSCR
jgi:hypothetical protein